MTDIEVTFILRGDEQLLTVWNTRMVNQAARFARRYGLTLIGGETALGADDFWRKESAPEASPEQP